MITFVNQDITQVYLEATHRLVPSLAGSDQVR